MNVVEEIFVLQQLDDKPLLLLARILPKLFDGCIVLQYLHDVGMV
jgi:hypothetical protein